MWKLANQLRFSRGNRVAKFIIIALLCEAATAPAGADEVELGEKEVPPGRIVSVDGNSLFFKPRCVGPPVEYSLDDVRAFSLRSSNWFRGNNCDDSPIGWLRRKLSALPPFPTSFIRYQDPGAIESGGDVQVWVRTAGSAWGVACLAREQPIWQIVPRIGAPMETSFLNFEQDVLRFREENQSETMGGKVDEISRDDIEVVRKSVGGGKCEHLHLQISAVETGVFPSSARVVEFNRISEEIARLEKELSSGPEDAAGKLAYLSATQVGVFILDGSPFVPTFPSVGSERDLTASMRESVEPQTIQSWCGDFLEQASSNGVATNEATTALLGACEQPRDWNWLVNRSADPAEEDDSALIEAD